MSPCDLFFLCLMVVLVRSQGSVRNVYTRQWVRERSRMAAIPNQEEQVEVAISVDENGHQGPLPQHVQAADHSHNGHNGFPEPNSLQVAPDAQGSVEGSAVSADVAPVTWRDLLTMNNVTNLAGFLSLLVTRDGQPVRAQDLFATQESQSGKLVIAGSEDVMASPDECSPRNMTVRLDVEMSDPGVVYYPECTQVQRCAGCTPSPFLACVPRYKEMIVLSVLKARYPSPGALSLVMQGFTPVRVERHLTCQVACVLKREDCSGPNMIYFPDQCRCQCKNYVPCSNGKVWSEESCQCRCRNQVPCCGSQDDRRCHLFFDHTFCECTLKESVGGDPNASQSEMEAWLANRLNRRPGEILSNMNAEVTNTATSPPDTTPTTTTPSASTTRATCSQLNCPRTMVRVMSQSGRCLCQYRRRPDAK